LLFSYKPFTHIHRIENYDIYVQYFFFNLFLYEPNDISELIHNDFREIFDTHPVPIGDRLRNIYKIYLTLSRDEKIMVQNAFKQNQLIEKICNNFISPIKYSDLENSISEELKKFFNSSWTLLTNKNETTNTKIKEKCGNIYEHCCDLFIDERQNFTICPVCGIEELLGEHEACEDPNDGEKKKVREAYDHYLPKALYPFISISFLNLIPICGHCNNDYKYTYDTPYYENNRQKCFYPFSNQEINDIDIKIIFSQKVSVLNKSSDWEVSFLTSSNIEEEIVSWDRIFQVKQRYMQRIKKKEKSWKNILIGAMKDKHATQSWSDFQEKFYNNIDIFGQTNGIIQKAYCDYYFSNLLPAYIEEITDE